MAQVAGKDIVVAIMNETAWGSDPGVPDANLVYVNTMGLKTQQNLIDSAAIASGRGIARPGQGNTNPGGPLVMEIAPEDVGLYLRNLIGTPATSGAGPYEHVFVPEALPVGFQIEKDWITAIAATVERWQGCRMAGATFTFPQEGFCTVSYDIVAKSYSKNAAVLDATVTDPGHTGYTGFEGSIKEGGSAFGEAISGTLVVENNINSDLYAMAGAGTRHSLSEGRCKISGTVTYVFEDFDVIDKAIANTETTVEFILTKGTGAGTAGNEKIAFLVDHCDITLDTPVLETESGLIATFGYTGFKSGADMGLEITLDNAVATYT